MVNALNKGTTDSGMMAGTLPAITEELLKHGFSGEDLVKIYGRKLTKYTCQDRRLVVYSTFLH